MRKKIIILGSTGSIGRQALEVVEANPGAFEVVALAAGGNWRLLADQARRFRPRSVALADERGFAELKELVADTETELLAGEGGVLEVASREADLVLSAITGLSGLRPTVEAIRAGNDIALANKETLVAGGGFVMQLCAERGARMIPVDSEHSALFQCLEGEDAASVEKLILTASGGPFRGYSRRQLEGVTPEETLKHPNWNMGRKITVDSATMMNKGLETIEASWLFDLPTDRIEVLVHPQSIVHSLVSFVDGSVKAQLGLPDMRVPIQYALFYPGRRPAAFGRLELSKVGKLTFEEPDLDAFPALRLAVEAARSGGTAPAVLNGANEVAVAEFLKGRLAFLDIPEVIERALAAHRKVEKPGFEDILAADAWAREFCRAEMSRLRRGR